MMLGNSIFYLLKGDNRLSPTKSSGVELRMWCSACPPKRFWMLGVQEFKLVA